jgi:hypothetical protein
MNTSVLINRIHQNKVSSCIMIFNFNFNFIARYWNSTLNRQCSSLDSSLAVTSLDTFPWGFPVFIPRESAPVTQLSRMVRDCLGTPLTVVEWLQKDSRDFCTLWGGHCGVKTIWPGIFPHVFSQPVVDAGIIHLPVLLSFLQDIHTQTHIHTCAFRKFELWKVCSFFQTLRSVDWWLSMFRDNVHCVTSQKNKDLFYTTEETWINACCDITAAY